MLIFICESVLLIERAINAIDVVARNILEF